MAGHWSKSRLEPSLLWQTNSFITCYASPIRLLPCHIVHRPVDGGPTHVEYSSLFSLAPVPSRTRDSGHFCLNIRDIIVENCDFEVISLSVDLIGPKQSISNIIRTAIIILMA